MDTARHCTALPAFSNVAPCPGRKRIAGMSEAEEQEKAAQIIQKHYWSHRSASFAMLANAIMPSCHHRILTLSIWSHIYATNLRESEVDQKVQELESH